MPDEPESQSPEQPAALTAMDFSRLLRKVARIFETGDLGNSATADGLLQLADFLHKLGPISIDALDTPRTSRRRATSGIHANYRHLAIPEVHRLLDDDGLSRTSLLRLARSRFGMAEARLRRMPLSEAIELVRGAAAHEESLDIIERNADVSGRARTS